jgi:hypothetical protein
MSHQFDLFADEIPAASKQNENNSTTALKLTAQDSKLTPSQQRFNRLLKRIEKLKNQLVEAQSISDAHRPAYHKTITPLRDRHQSLTREMVLLLDRRLQRKGLSRTHRDIATMILCNLCEQLAAEGDEEMQILHDKHSSESLAEKEQAAILQTRAMMEDVLGEPLAGDEPLDNLHDVFSIGMARLREAAEAEQEAYQQTRKKKPTAAQRKAEAAQQEAETTLRKVMRQLASALHPDREKDPDERARKTDLMSEANAAYDRRDLVALLQIQLRTELTDTASIAKMAEEKIASLTLLLKQQTQELDNELHNRLHAIRDEFCLKSYETISVANLRRNLLIAEAALQQDLNAMQQDLQNIENDKALKSWLKAQDRHAQDAMIADFEGCMFDPFEYK